MEVLAMTPLRETYRQARVLVTGHTGFKGSWLSLWLDSLGATVAGVALAPDTQPCHWQLLGLDIEDQRVDIRDHERLATAVRDFAPDAVFHLAAQALVRASYRDPLTTWSTNVTGTAHVLEACRRAESVRAVVVVTTDKCYENREWVWGYRERDRLGGHDPYSASKAAAELVAASYRTAFFDAPNAPMVATARAGNVVGGGDWAADRLIPDLVRATQAGAAAEIRAPNATRPWQHVLDSLHAYLRLGQALLQGDREFADSWNFGPHEAHSVREVLEIMSAHWPELAWRCSDGTHPRETRELRLDSSKARSLLHWRSVWDLPRTLQMTSDWYRRFVRDGVVISRKQLEQFEADAAAISC